MPRPLAASRLLLAILTSIAVLSAASAIAAPVPRLVVVVSVDQLPARYLTQMEANFSDEGLFRRMMRHGAWYPNCHHRHAFTVTAPGHAALLTGADPMSHGIIGNAWFDRATGKSINCVEDAEATAVGAPAQGYGVSPRNLLVPTLGDELKLRTGGKSKVLGVSLKDRAAVLMTGRSADAAYWFDETSGNWITSTYYRSDLPGYLRNFNDGPAMKAAVGKPWELLLAADRYQQIVPDDNPYETNVPFFGRKFPHPMPPEPNAVYYKLLEATPFGNEMTLAAASEIIEQEKLGQDEHPDLLCVGLSANDYVGHAFGPQSLEVQDITLRTDLQLGAFVKFIESRLGDAPWVLALSSDHGVGPVPELAATLKLPGLRNPLGEPKALAQRLEERLRSVFGTPAENAKLVLHAEPGEIYLNTTVRELAGDNLVKAQRLVQAALLELAPVAAAHTRDELSAANSGQGLFEQFRLEFNPQRSGDVLFVLEPYAISGKNAATHGSPWNYDSHVPLLFLGHGVRPGRYANRVSPGAIGPTLAVFLNVEAPPAAAVEPLFEIVE